MSCEQTAGQNHNMKILKRVKIGIFENINKSKLYAGGE